MCVELFGRELDVDIILEKSQARHREWFHNRHKKELEMLQNVETALNFRTKKNIFLPIRDGIEEALSRSQLLLRKIVFSDGYDHDYEWNLRDRMRQRIKEVSSPKNKDAVDEITYLQPAPRPRLATGSG